MEVALKKVILAAVTTKQHQVANVPTFFAKDEAEKETITVALSRILEAVAHDLGDGLYILVKH